MTTPGNEEPRQQAPAEPRERGPNASGFWDFKASHWVEVFLTAALIGVGLAQFSVYNRQAGIMKVQAQISGQQLTDSEAAAKASFEQARTATQAAVDGANAATKQAMVADDTEKRQLRSYVMIESSTIGIDSNGKPTDHLVVKNYGLTPTYSFRHWACTVVRDWPDRDRDFPTASMLTDSASAPESLIAPNGTIMKDAGSCFSNEEPISDPVRAEIKAGHKAVFAIGVMKYRDAFGMDRETRYRRSWNDIRAADGYGGNCADDGCPKEDRPEFTKAVK